MKTTLTTALIVLASVMALRADVPLLINYQGSVTDAGGAAIGTTTPVNRRVIFRIWDHSSSTATANRKWTEEQTVTILNGEFSIMLGQGTNYPSSSPEPRPALDTVFGDNTTDRFLEITVDNGDGTIDTAVDQAIAPRQQLTSVGYAMRAKIADSVGADSDLMLTPRAGAAAGNFGLGWYGDATTDRTFSGIPDINGPVLYGTGGGALAAKNGASETLALRWNDVGNVGIGSAALGTVATPGTTKLVLQGNDATAPPQQLNIRGASDINKRLLMGYNTTSNYGALQSYSAASTTSSLLLNPIGGNVGIGNTSPTSRLDVTGGIRATGATTGGYSFNTGDADGGLFSPADGTLTLNTNNTERLRVDSAGNVGIGTTSPTSRLHVNGTFNAVTSVTTPTLNATTVGVGGGTVTSATNRLYVSGDSTATAPDQLVIRGSTDTDLRLDLGMKTDNFNGGRRGVIQAHDSETAYLPLSLNPDGGDVGIGTGTGAPRARLEVNGSVSYTLTGSNYKLVSNGVGSDGGGYTPQVSILASHKIVADSFHAISDMRIKNVLGQSDGTADLRQLQKIEITNYRHKDEIGKGSGLHKKVIAQQVEKVFPEAVSQMTNAVPDIYAKAAVKDGWVVLNSTLKKGERVRLIAEKEEGTHEVLEVREGAFRTAFNPKGEALFVYGREVKDFRTVDYEAISMLNVSATQEIARKLEAKSAEVEALEQRVKKLEARDKARDAKLAALEKLLLSADKPAARTASLKKTADGAE
jgi:hypothetical protein